MDDKNVVNENIRIDSTTTLLALAGFVYAVIIGYIVGAYIGSKELNLLYCGLFIFIGGFLLVNGLFIEQGAKKQIDES